MKKFLIVVIIVGAFCFALFNYHFILTDNSLRVLKKTDITLDSTFVDARGANKIKVLLNPALLKAGIKKALDDASKAVK